MKRKFFELFTSYREFVKAAPLPSAHEGEVRLIGLFAVARDIKLFSALCRALIFGIKITVLVKYIRHGVWEISSPAFASLQRKLDVS